MRYDYDLVVIGAGAGGLTASGIGASLGAKTLLVEKDRFGGDCTWHGCVPSKTLLAEAKRIKTARDIVGAENVPVNFAGLMERLRATRQEIYEEADKPEVIEEFGVETVVAAAEFRAPHELSLSRKEGTENITARFVILATGASPRVPPIDGLEGIDYLTSNTLFEISDLPTQLGIIGGGPIGVEMAQAFAHLGTAVTLFESGEQILSHSDRSLARDLAIKLTSAGVEIETGARVSRLTQTDGAIEVATGTGTHRVDSLLVATGRAPNVSGLGLEAAGVSYTSAGIAVNASGRTNQRHIYAIGDVTGGLQFTHSSEKDAKVAVFRALAKVSLGKDDDLIPRVTYTSPELAEVGKTAKALRKDGTDFDTYEQPLSEVDRAITEGKTTGRLRIFTKAGSGKILGAAILSPRAGELIAEITLAMENGLKLSDIAGTVHAYPTYSLALQRVAEQYYTNQDHSWLVKILQLVFSYQGSTQSNK